MNMTFFEPSELWQSIFHWKTTVASGMIITLILLAEFYILSQLGALLLLSFSRKRGKRIAVDLHGSLEDAKFPAVSVITSLKGPTPGATESVRSLLLQDYPGPIEIVFATLDANEALIAEIEQVIRETASNCTVRWVNPVNTAGLNPRTAKIHQAYLASQFPWVLMVCVDTRFSPNYLKKRSNSRSSNPRTT